MTSRVLVAVRVKASPVIAFKIFTEEIGIWWQANPLFAFTPQSPGTIAFEPPSKEAEGRLTETLATGKIFEIGTVKVWIPGERLAFTWRQAAFRPDQNTEVEIRFEAVGNETRVTVEHRGWDSIPSAHAARHGFPNTTFLRRHGEWWQALLGSFSRSALKHSL